ncbi:MAG: sialate O-acetylesterase [Clostridia bacterium]|nr:sialate O-acetylesterase [Clostridia bacterium]
MYNTFLLIGQSNMAGRGPLGDVPAIVNPEVRMFREGAWRTAEDPLHIDKPALLGIGPGMSFADALQRRHGVRIGLVPCAFGGTALREWQPGGRLFDGAVAATLDALRAGGRLKGILWHQGESDSDAQEDAERYETGFWSMCRPLLEAVGGTDVPFLIGELGGFLAEYTPGCAFFRTTNRKLAEIAASGPSFGWVSAEGLTDKGDRLHFDARSQRTFGLRYADAWEQAAARTGTKLE